MTLFDNSIKYLIYRVHSQLVAYGYSAVAQSVANATGASTDMMPSSKLSELLQIAKYKSKYRSTIAVVHIFTQPPILLLDDEDESDDEYSGKGFDRDSPSDDIDINMTITGFDIESMANARTCL
jgi:cleavage stimulation factor subunit 1